MSHEERALFVSESQEYLQILNNGLLQLEQGTDPEVVAELFRAAHSLKGMAATLGEQGVVGLTHAMEEFLSRVRETGEQLAAEDLDLLLAACDGLEAWLAAVQKGDEATMAQAQEGLETLEASVRAGFQRLLGREQTAASQVETAAPGQTSAGDLPLELNLYDQELIQEATRQGLQATDLFIRLDPGCRMKSVRVFLIFRALEQVGEIIKSQPPAEELDEERFDDRFRLLVVSSEPPEALAERVRGLAEVAEVVARPVTAGEAGAGSHGAAGPGQAAAPREPAARKNGGPGLPKELASIRDNFLNERFLRVDVSRLDQLVNLVGELVIQRNRLLSVAEETGFSSDVIEGIDRIATDLQTGVMALRMVPLRTIFQRFPRMVRDLARSLGKQVELALDGEETELDRSLIHSLADPLIHLLRNAIDHGIEPPDERARKGKPPTGRVAVTARQEGNRVVIEVEDDGAGVDVTAIRRKLVERGLLSAKEVEELSDRQALQWIFRPGFSTAKQVSDISGRGVGMDVVRSAVEGAGGSLQIDSELGQGTKIRLELPLTLAIIQAMLVELAGERVALPLDVISEVLRVGDADIRTLGGGRVLNWRGQILPVIDAAERLQLRPAQEVLPPDSLALVLERGGRSVCCLVDEVVGHEEVVIKPVSKLVSTLPEVSGATVLGSGRVAVIINPEPWLEG